MPKAESRVAMVALFRRNGGTRRDNQTGGSSGGAPQVLDWVRGGLFGASGHVASSVRLFTAPSAAAANYDGFAVGALQGQGAL